MSEFKPCIYLLFVWPLQCPLSCHRTRLTATLYAFCKVDISKGCCLDSAVVPVLWLTSEQKAGGLTVVLASPIHFPGSYQQTNYHSSCNGAPVSGSQAALVSALKQSCEQKLTVIV